MDQNTISTTGMITGIMVIGCGILVSPIAIGMLASYPSEIWWLGIILTFACCLMIYGGIQSIRKAKVESQQAEEEKQRINEEVAELGKSTTIDITATPMSAAFRTSGEVLAHWTYSDLEWKKFIAGEKKRRMSSTIYEAVGIIILGTIVLMISRGVNIFGGLLFSIITALIISYIRVKITMGAYGGKSKENYTSITDQSIIINGKLNPFRSDRFWLDKIQILNGDPDTLEISYAWKTRKGKTFDELRIPVPINCREEAQMLIQKIRHNELTAQTK